MPKFEDFKVGDVWIGKEGAEYEILDLNPANKEVLVKIGPRGYRLSNLGLTHKKLDTSKPVRVIGGLGYSYIVVGQAKNGNLILEADDGCVQVYPAERLENVPDKKRKKTADLVLLDVGGQLHITSSECAD